MEKDPALTSIDRSNLDAIPGLIKEAVEYFGAVDPRIVNGIQAATRGPNYRRDTALAHDYADMILGQLPAFQEKGLGGASLDERVLNITLTAAQLNWGSAKLRYQGMTSIPPEGSPEGYTMLMRRTFDEVGFRSPWLKPTDINHSKKMFVEIDGTIDLLNRAVELGEFDRKSGTILGYNAAIARNCLKSMFDATRIRHEFDARHDSIAEAEKVTAELQRSNDMLWDNLRKKKTYTVKDTIVDSLHDGRAEQWLVLNANRVNKKNIDRRFLSAKYPGKIEAILIGSGGGFSSSKSSLDKFESEYSGFEILQDVTSSSSGIDLKGNLNNDDPFADNTFFMLLGKDGEMYTFSGAPLKKLSEKSARSLEYEKVRSEVMGIMFDLQTPYYMQDIVDARMHTGLDKGENKQTELDKLRKITLIRTKLIEDVDKKTLQKRMNEQIASERIDAKNRTKAEHSVVGHIRKLPKGYRATPQQRALCWEDLEVVLADEGETYVKEHTRGSEKPENDKGHKAVHNLGVHAVRLEASKEENQ